MEPEEVFSGGACSNNGKADALAGYRIYFKDGDPRNTSVYGIPGRQSNNCAHLIGLSRAIELCDKTRPAIIKTCSKLTADTATQLDVYKNNGWKKTNGKVLANLDLWKRVHAQLQSCAFPVQVVHVPQHINMRGNTFEQYDAFRSTLKKM